MTPWRPGPVGAMFAVVLAVALTVPAGCARAPEPAPLALTAPLPDDLADLGVLARSANALEPVAGVAYALAHPLFSDYARKYRTVHLPADAGPVRVGAGDETLAFPVGTLITKTFYYPVHGAAVVLDAAAPFAGPDAPLATEGVRLLETRVLRHLPDGWEAVSYVWDEAGRMARKARTGALFTLVDTSGDAFDYLVPDVNQCAGCHAADHGAGTLAPIGPKPGNLSAVRLDEGTQFELWTARGLVAAADVEPWPHTGARAARAYLDANCAHCHSAVGAADTAGLDLSYDAPRAGLGLCKSPVAAGRGSGGRAYDLWPGRADASILLYRMDHRDPGVMMPELGRTLVHSEGVALIRDWIDGLEGDCDAGSVL